MKRKIIGRKLLSVLLTTVTMSSVLFSGCGGRTESDSEKSSDNLVDTIFTGELEKNAKIYVLENDTAIQKGYFKELIAAFNEAYKEYGITAVDANMDQYLDLANDGPYGYGPDVLYQANDVIMKYVEGKHIYPLPIEKLDCYSQIPDAAWKAYKVEVGGSEYCCGVPVNVQAGMLYYRKDLLPENWKSDWDTDKNEIPDMIENWNAMYRFSIERHQESKDKYGYMKSLYDVYFSSGFLFSYGGYVFGDNNMNPSDIGFSAGEAEKGAQVLNQLASVMSQECIDDTVTTSAYNKIAKGLYFATISTPDVYKNFFDELVMEYESEGLQKKDAEAKAKENLVMTTLPKLPKSGDLTDDSAGWIDSKEMGGINGYAVSAYTKAPNACLAFVDFATKYEMVIKRAEFLGIAPAREDAAKDAGGVSELLYNNLEAGNITLMPSIKEVAQIWTPAETFFTDLAKDAFRVEKQKKFKDITAMKKGLENVDKQIYDAIFTLK